MNRASHGIHGLYALTPDISDTRRLSDIVRAALTGGVTLLQYRNKTADEDLRRQQAIMLQALCSEYGAQLIINDDVALAIESNASGVHLGKDDMQIAQARAQLGNDKIIGVSCYNEIALAQIAHAQGADYIAFGSFFPSLTKPGAVRATPELLASARKQFDVPIVAIGGITLDNARVLIQSGADAVAVITALFDASDIQKTARSFSSLFE